MARRHWLRITNLLFRFSPSFHPFFESCLPFSIALCCLFFLPLPLCDLFCCSNCHNVAVWGFTCTFACQLSPHLQAILPGLGNLSCGWLPREQMFLMPLVEEKKALKVTPLKTCQLHDKPGPPSSQEFCQSRFSLSTGNMACGE